MKRDLSLILAVLSFSCMCCGGLTSVQYSTEHISGDQWVYHYSVSNLALAEGIEEFTIWFDHGKYESISKTSDAALDAGWDQIVWQPNDALQNNGGFDALALTAPIAIGEDVSGFAVSFTWNGSGGPGSQFYEIVNPDNTSEVLNSGFTVMVPEPSSIVLVIGSCVCFAFKKRRM